MGSKVSDLPFPIGSTLNDNYASGTGDNDDLEGKEYWVEDYVISAGSPSTFRSGRMKRLRVVRNISGITLAAKRLVSFDTSAGKAGRRVDGYSYVEGQDAYPVDDYVDSNGVADGYLFYVVVEGPALVTTSVAGDGTNVITANVTKVVAETAAASTGTTAGRVVPQVLTGATAVLARNITGALGTAMSAKTTANTAADLLVDIKRGGFLA